MVPKQNIIRCVGEDSDADQSITSISDSNGVYWNVKGKLLSLKNYQTKIFRNNSEISREDFCKIFEFYDAGLNCGQDTTGEGFDNVACNKIEINAEDKAVEGEAQYSACFDSGCVSVNQTLTFRAPGVFLSKGFWGQSKVPIVS